MERRPRFERQPGKLALQLTSRDLTILQHVARHRFLDSRQIVTLLGGSQQHILRRLQRLFHHGFLDRPRSQVRYFSKDGSRPIAYALGRSGARVLTSAEKNRPRYDNRNVKQLYLDHTLLVAEVMLAFEQASRRPGAPRLFWEDKLAIGQSTNVPVQWKVTLKHGGVSKRFGVRPDAAFALQSSLNSERILFFVEADRATMPVMRSSLESSSFFKKLLAYEATWTQGVHQERFTCTRFRVLTVTTSASRAKHLAETCAELSRGRGLFLFTDAAALRAYHAFDLPWLNANGGTELLRV